MRANQAAHGLAVSDSVGAPTWAAVTADDPAPPYATYIVSARDAAGPFVRIPGYTMERAQLKCYYTHLDDYADGLREGIALRRIQVIVYAGTTPKRATRCAAPALRCRCRGRERRPAAARGGDQRLSRTPRRRRGRVLIGLRGGV